MTSFDFSPPGAASSFYSVDLDADAHPRLEMNGESGSRIDLQTSGGGDARLHLHAASGQGVRLEADEDDGCGQLHLFGSNPVTIDGCSGAIDSQGRVLLRNAAGAVTIELDPETGNIYYTGEMLRRRGPTTGRNR